jgi:hypothetical protein
MKIIIEIDRTKTIETLESNIRKLISFLYAWLTTDGEVLGYILAVIHFMISALFYILIFVCHTVYPSFKFQLFVFSCVLLIWIHHIVLKVCISVVAEKNLTNRYAPSAHLFKVVLDFFSISMDSFTNYFVLVETAVVGMFGLELLSRYSNYLHKLFNISY